MAISLVKEKSPILSFYDLQLMRRGGVLMLMLEVTDSGDDHCHAVIVTIFYGFVVAN